MKILLRIALAVLLAVVCGCGGGGGDKPQSPAVLEAPIVKPPTPGDGQAVVAWEAVPSAVSYNLYWADAPGVTPQNGTRLEVASSPCTLAGLNNEKTYYAVVTANCPQGETKPSAELMISLLPPPTNVTAAAGDGKAIIDWLPAQGAASYDLYWSTTQGAARDGTKITGVTAPYVFPGENGVTYYLVVVAAYEGGGKSTMSGELSVKPTSTGTIQVSW